MPDILIRAAGGKWRSPDHSGYENEAHLQALLKEHPELIPGVPENAKVSIEFQSGSGPADVVAIDALNGLTLVECKLASNPEVRREIVGQVLDYSSRFWNLPFEEFETQWRTRTGESISDYPDGDPIRSRLESNLSSGEFRIILAVDEINADLRRIIEYLNHITVPSVAVIAVVYTRSLDNGLEILSRQIYGEELAQSKAIRSRDLRERWTAEQFLAWIDVNDLSVKSKARTLLSALDEFGFETAGGKALTPSLNARLEMDALGFRYPLAIYTQSRGTGLELRFGDFTSTPDIAEKFLISAEAVLGQLIDGQAIRDAGYSKYPKILLEHLDDEKIGQIVLSFSRALKVSQN